MISDMKFKQNIFLKDLEKNLAHGLSFDLNFYFRRLRFDQTEFKFHYVSYVAFIN